MAETISIANLPPWTPTTDDILVFVDRADWVTKRADVSWLPWWSGDVVWPASSTDSVPVLFDWTTGKLIKNSTPTGTGNPVLQTSPTLTTPRFADLGFIADSNGNEMLAFNSNASAVNYIELENNVTGSAVHIRAKWDDANVWLHLVAKGATGYVNISDPVDETKRIRIDPSANTTGVITTLKSSSTTAQTITLPNATDTLVGRTTIDTLTNKRVTDRIKQDASHTTSVTMDSDSYDEYDITAQAWALLFNNPSWTPTNCQKLMVRIKDNWTARALTYGTQFASWSWTLPTTTTLSKKLWIWFEWDSTDSKWYCLATGVQP